MRQEKAASSKKSSKQKAIGRKKTTDQLSSTSDNTMTAQKIWFKLVSPQETAWTQVSLANVDNVDDLKKAIKNKKPVDLKDCDADRLILKAKKSVESDEQAKELENPRESVHALQRHFGIDLEILVTVPVGK